MAKVKLGREQTLTLDGAPLVGVREVDISLDYQTADVTSFEHRFVSTLPIREDCTLRMLIYHQEDYDRVQAKLNQHPPQPVTIQVSNVGQAKFVPTAVKIAQPIDGVMAWDVTLKYWNYLP